MEAARFLDALRCQSRLEAVRFLKGRESGKGRRVVACGKAIGIVIMPRYKWDEIRNAVLGRDRRPERGAKDERVGWIRKHHLRR